MRLRARRGQALVQVIVTLTTMAVIAAALMQLGLMRLTVADRVAGGGQGKMGAQAGYQMLLDDWANKGTCHDPAGAGGNPFSCPGGVANTCACNCTGTVGGNTVNVQASGSINNCSIQSTFVSP